MSTMRGDEEFAKQRFDDYLRSRTSEDIEWRDGNQNVAPDFYLTVGNEHFAVEVTAITEQVETPRRSVPKMTVDQSAKDFVQEIEKEVQSTGTLNGTYYISFPRVQVDFYGVRKALKKQLIDLISRTQSDKQVPLTNIEIDGMRYCSIQKSSKPGANIYVGFYPSSCKFEGESFDEACELLERAVSGKAKRLAHLTQHKILLILEEFMFVEPKAYKYCTENISQISNFHTVFIVASDSTEDYVLHTQCNEWA